MGNSFAQKVKLHGYVQKSTPGIKAARDFDENGNAKAKTEPSKGSYYVYITAPPNTRLYLVEGWLKGERIGLKAEPVDGPAKITNDNGEERVLVPKTNAQVWQLTGTKEVSGKNFPKAKTLAKTAELVVVYKLNGKFGYATLKQLSKLETNHLQ